MSNVQGGRSDALFGKPGQRHESRGSGVGSRGRMVEHRFDGGGHCGILGGRSRIKQGKYRQRVATAGLGGLRSRRPGGFELALGVMPALVGVMSWVAMSWGAVPESWSA